jgi:hypothetical protein
MRIALVLILAATTLPSQSGCAVRREVGPGRPIVQYDYAVLSRETPNDYVQRATPILDRSFVVLTEDDPRLGLPYVQQKACTMTIDGTRGFWSTSGWVEVQDYNHNTPVLTSHMRKGMLWVSPDEDVMIAVHDVAAARADGPPVPPEARNPVARAPIPERVAAPGGRTVADRLAELNDLKARGLISDAEYAAQRKNIIKDQ